MPLAGGRAWHTPGDTGGRLDIYGTAKSAMQRLATEFPTPGDGTMNEATTRLRLINRVLTDALGWRPADITAEEHGPEGYVDYALGRPARDVIVEAKKEGITFKVPEGLSGRPLIDIGTLREDPGTRAAIDQATGYCQARGVPVAMITNGYQYIAFYASRQDGVAPLKGQALCFHSLEELEVRFEQAWAMLSREGVAQRNLQRLLAVGNGGTVPPPKLADSILGYPGFRPRSELETNLSMLGNAFIRDIANPLSVTDEFYRQCYCNTGALSQYALVSREVLLDRYAPTKIATGVEMKPVREKRGKLSPLLQGDIFSAMTSSPLIILGDVGVGKTMFLQHFIRIDGADALDGALVFYVDFGAKRTLTESLEEYVESEVSKRLEEHYRRDIYEASFVRAVYNKEVNQFGRGIYSHLKADDPAAFRLKEADHLHKLASSRQHLLRSLRHLHAQHNLVIVLDNIDQWAIEDQDRVFLIAQSLAAQWPVTVFVSLRPETFHRSKSTGALSAYHLRVFTVSPPRVADVIHRRIDYAKKVAANQASQEVPAPLQITMGDLQSYLDMLDASFLASNELCDIVDNLSGGNVRNAVAMLARFVGSPYVSTERILDESRSGGRYTVPPHELLRASLYGDHAYYDPSRTEIVNVFDISTGEAREHFLLSALLRLCQQRGGASHGFVEAGDIYETLTSYGFSQEQVGFQLKRAVDRRLLDVGGADAGGPYRTNQSGAYAALRLPQHFTYVDAVIVDTPIADSRTRASMRDVRSFADRIDRVNEFIGYLDTAWSDLGGLGTVYDWLPVASALRADIADAVGRVDRSRRFANPAN